MGNSCQTILTPPILVIPAQKAIRLPSIVLCYCFHVFCLFLRNSSIKMRFSLLVVVSEGHSKVLDFYLPFVDCSRDLHTIESPKRIEVVVDDRWYVNCLKAITLPVPITKVLSWYYNPFLKYKIRIWQKRTKDRLKAPLPRFYRDV